MSKRAKAGALSGVIGLFLALQLLMLLEGDVPRRSPLVQEGLLDASGWSFENDGIMHLDGRWFFYPNELADPLQLPRDRRVELDVPSDWRDAELGQEARGVGTYEMTVLLPSSAPEVIGLKVSNIRMAHRLYVNGRLAHASGNPADNRADDRPLNTPYTAYATPEDGRLQLVIQAANYKYYQGGIAQSILIGLPGDIARYASVSFGIGMAGFFMTVSFGLYALFIYLMRTREQMYMYAGLFFLTVSLTVACADEKMMMVLFSGLPFDVLYKLQDLSLSGSLLLLLAFFRIVDRSFISKRAYGAVAAPILLYAAAVVALPYEWYIEGKIWMSPVQVGICLWSVARWSYLAVKARKEKERRTERLFMFGTALFVAGSLFFHYMYLEQLLPSRLLSFISYFSFIFTINLFLALCSTNMMKRSEQLSEELLRSNELKNDFLQRTSHELKTPLHGIRNLAEYLFQHAGQLSSEQQRQLGLIVDTTSRLSYIVNDLIDASRLRDASVYIQMRAVELSAVVEHVLQIVAFQLGDKPLSLVNRVPAGLFVSADEQRLQQIVYNLASNAVKYSSEGLVTASALAGAGQVTLTISDQGFGIAKEEWELVFMDTYRSETPGRPLVEGMGLGLYISRGLARKMGGDLYVASSRPEAGTEMRLELRAASPPETVEQASVSDAFRYGVPIAAGDGGQADSGKYPAAGKTILLVDDDPANIEVLKLILQHDYRLLLAYKGESALDVLEEEHVDLMIADLIMPGMSGIELTRIVRERHSALQLPIIIATANAHDSQVQLAYQSGATDYVAKPFAAGEIRKRVHLLLQLSSTMEAALAHERAFLAAQIKPHFLYNALNNIIALCYDDPERAAELLVLLSRHLRRMFQQESVANTVSLLQELEIVQAYIEIEKLRIEDRLHFVTEIDPSLALERLQIKTLLIQPLVENAVGHGLFHKEGVGTVALRIQQLANHLHIVVQDDGVGMSGQKVDLLLAGKDGRGVGLSNVRRRIAAIPGATFDLHSKEGAGTTCTIVLPLEKRGTHGDPADDLET